MKTSTFRSISRSSVITVGIAVLLSACPHMSEHIRDETAGLNGGFETTQAGLPVNWLVYTPKTIPIGDYDLLIDTLEYHGGRQSLRFDVRECSSAGGWHSPGLSREFPATPGRAYTVGFWAKIAAGEIVAKVGGVSAMQGDWPPRARISDTAGHWRHYEYTYTMPAKFDRIRFELNVVRPGTIWIDDVTID